MKVYDYKLGRLGNAIFRYFASTLFRIIYNAERIYNESESTCHLNDNNFIDWMNYILKDQIPEINKDQNYGFYGYYQHDEIFKKYKNQIIFWIKTHPNELLFTDGNNNNIKYFNYNEISYKSIDILPKKINKNYDVVIHLRLEDFINNNDVIHPLIIKNILDEINNNTYCFVINKPKLEIEEQYLNYFKDYGKENNCEIIIESNDILTDYQIMCNAKVLVCSCSTLSWCAALLSESVILVYFPNYYTPNLHTTFKKPIDNTILYNITKCNSNDLSNFLSNNEQIITKQDIYCAIDCKKQPITKRILEYIKDIKNGFYIEAGAYDGLLQSNTKFLEEEYGWSGMLIEPSPKIFELLEKNRPDNININKCLVSSKYQYSTIQGAFDNGPMSSVNNIRNIQDAELIYVSCNTLENILNDNYIEHIDFMTIDTEGYEFEVLEGLNLTKNRPTYLLIEIYSNDKDKIFNYLEQNNYLLLENITNYNYYDNPGWDGTHNDYLFKAL
jgi:FkbM family methyltransferase